MSDDDVLLAAEVAEDLRCSTRYISHLCATGQMRHFKIGRELRILRSAVKEYKAGRQQGSAA